MYQVREANQMVEEFMLAANMSVAGKILKEFPSCSLLRCVNSSSLDFEFAGPEKFFFIALYVRALKRRSFKDLRSAIHVQRNL